MKKVPTQRDDFVNIIHHPHQLTALPKDRRYLPSPNAGSLEFCGPQVAAHMCKCTWARQRRRICASAASAAHAALAASIGSHVRRTCAGNRKRPCAPHLPKRTRLLWTSARHAVWRGRRTCATAPHSTWCLPRRYARLYRVCAASTSWASAAHSTKVRRTRQGKCGARARASAAHLAKKSAAHVRRKRRSQARTLRSSQGLVRLRVRRTWATHAAHASSLLAPHSCNACGALGQVGPKDQRLGRTCVARGAPVLVSGLKNRCWWTPPGLLVRLSNTE